MKVVRCVFVGNYVHMVQCDQRWAHLVPTPHSVPPASSHIGRGNQNCGQFRKIEEVIRVFSILVPLILR